MLASFERTRERLLALSYHMIGNMADAEDLVQECYLRWQAQNTLEIQNHEAFLVRIQSRLCLDFLRSARVKRERYVGPWLPEPLLTDTRGPEQQNEQRQLLCFSLLALIHQLTPVQRCCWILYEVLGYSHAEIAQMTQISVANSRQQFSRARRQLLPYTSVAPPVSDADEHILHKLLMAIATGNSEELVSCLIEDCTLYADGGGKVVCATKPLTGKRALSRYLIGIAKRTTLGAPPQRVWLNHQVAVLLSQTEKIDTGMILETYAGQIRTIFMIRNPDKLVLLNSQQ